MKKIIVALMCIGMAVSAFAQRGVNTIDQKHYNKVYASYSPYYLGWRDGSVTSLYSGFNNFGLEYMHGIAVAKFPLYIEFGGGFEYMNYNGSLGGLDHKINVFSLNIPVNVAYRMSFKGGKMHLTPFTGFYGRIGLSGKAEIARGSVDMFSDMNIKRFKLGWQSGVAFDINKFYVQVGYLTDITSCSKEVSMRLGGFRIGLGVIF